MQTPAEPRPGTPESGERGASDTTSSLPDSAMFETLLNTSDDVFAVISPDVGFLYLSPSVKRLLGWTPEELLGRFTSADDVHPGDREQLLSHIKAAHHGPARTWETLHFRRRRRDGTWAEVDASGSCDGVCFYGIMRDASEQHAAEAALKALLLSTSYDLRIHAQNIQAASQLLQSRDCVRANEEAAFLADAVHSGCNSLLLGVVANVLELRNLERGEYTLTEAPFGIADAVRHAIQLCRSNARATAAADVDVVWANEAEASELLPDLVCGDEGKCLQIVSNMVSNAQKFGRGAPVTVRVALEAVQAEAAQDEHAAARRMLRVDVSDCGAGLTPAQCASIFLPYAHASPTAGGGAGIGLYLSREFARALGGDVSVQSTPDEGSTFTMRVPVRVLTEDETARMEVSGIAERLDEPRSAELPTNADFAAQMDEVTLQPDIGALSEFVTTQAAAGDTAAQEQIVAHMMETLLQHAPDAFVCFTSETPPVVTYASSAVTRMLGLLPGELRGRSLYDMLHPEDVQNTATVLAPLLNGAARTVSVLRRLRCAREPAAFRWVDMHVVREGGALYSVWRDATQRKHTQAALHEFLITTSHDLRTPAHSIVTAAQLLAACDAVMQDADAAFLVQAISTSAALMLGVITNVMAMANIQASAPPELQPPTTFSPRALVLRVLQTCNTADGREYPVTWDEDGSGCGGDSGAGGRLAELVEADEAAVAQMVHNMLLWLVRRGVAVTLRASCRMPPGSQDECELRVEAHAPALQLRADECERMFSPFFITPAESEGTTQTGLGLYVARTMARTMRGDMEASCADGALLQLRVPVRVPSAGLPQSPPRSSLLAPQPDASPLKRTASAAALGSLEATTPAPGERQRAPRCLLVEDHALNAKLVSRLLERHGFAVSVAANGGEGLAMLKSALRGAPGTRPPPDLVLCDLQMPVMGGVEMVRQLRAFENATQPPGRRLLVLALSANVSETHVAECIAAGMDGHLSKPLRAEAIPQLLRNKQTSA